MDRRSLAALACLALSHAGCGLGPSTVRPDGPVSTSGAIPSIHETINVGLGRDASPEYRRLEAPSSAYQDVIGEAGTIRATSEIPAVQDVINEPLASGGRRQYPSGRALEVAKGLDEAARRTARLRSVPEEDPSEDDQDPLVEVDALPKMSGPTAVADLDSSEFDRFVPDQAAPVEPRERPAPHAGRLPAMPRPRLSENLSAERPVAKAPVSEARNEPAPTPPLDEQPLPTRSQPPRAELAETRTDAEPTPAKSDPEVSLAAAPRPAAKREEYVPSGFAATVGSEVITFNAFQAAVKDRIKQINPQGPIGKDDLNAIALRVLDDMIDRSLILQEAKRELKNPKQLQLIDEQIDRAWREHELPPLLRATASADIHELRKKLADQGKSLDVMRAEYRQNTFARDYLMMKLQNRATVSLAEMREYYESHLKEFDRPAMITWREIVVETARHPNREDARRKAESLFERLRKGEDFATLAKSESEGPTAREGGLWETTPGSYAVPSVNDALNSLEIGAISAIIEAPAGFHLIRVEARRPAGPARFDEAQDETRAKVFDEKQRKASSEFLGKLRAKAVITSPLFDGTASAPADSAGITDAGPNARGPGR